MNSIWDEVKEKIDIVDVVSEYVPDLKSAGSNYKCLSPFRKEKSPSLIISPQKQIWHDFGSGDGGDVFGFVSQIENITRWEALKKLAKNVGVEVKERKKFNKPKTAEEEVQTQQIQSRFERGQKLLLWVSDIYHKLLLKILQDRQHPITQYCLKRHLSQSTIEEFKLGYAPRNRFLLNLAKQYKLDLSLLYEIGVLKTSADISAKSKDQTTAEIKNNPNSLSDKFVDRLMIPVFDKNGSPVGFTGRVLPYDKSERPKYLNSPQNDWFDKGRLWFGWHLARKNIVSGKKAIIVEGNMDVVASFSHKLPFALASQGTSFTQDQIKLLKQLTRTIWLAFDNDEAGQIASKKFFKSATSISLEVKKVIIPSEYKDLDEYLSSFENKEFSEDTLETVSFLDYFLTQKQIELNSKDQDTQKEAILEAIDLFVVLDELSLEQYLKKLSNLTGIGLNTLQKVVSQKKKEQRFPSTNNTKEVELDTRKESDSYDQALINLQFIVSFYLFFSETVITKEKLSIYYLLIKNLLGDRLEFETLDEYLEKQREVLLLVWEEGVESKTSEFFDLARMSLDRLIDNNFGKLLLDGKMHELYLSLKSSN